MKEWDGDALPLEGFSGCVGNALPLEGFSGCGGDVLPLEGFSGCGGAAPDPAGNWDSGAQWGSDLGLPKCGAVGLCEVPWLVGTGTGPSDTREDKELPSEPNGAAGAASNEVERDVNHTLKLYPHKNEKLLLVQITAFMRRIYGLLVWYKYIQYTNTSGNKFHWTTLLF